MEYPSMKAKLSPGGVCDRPHFACSQNIFFSRQEGAVKITFITVSRTFKINTPAQNVILFLSLSVSGFFLPRRTSVGATSNALRRPRGA